MIDEILSQLLAALLAPSIIKQALVDISNINIFPVSIDNLNRSIEITFN